LLSSGRDLCYETRTHAGLESSAFLLFYYGFVMTFKPDRFRRKPKRTGRKPAKRVGPPVERTVRVSSLGRHCDGIATEEGGGNQRRHYVPFALPEELVRIRSTGKQVELLDVIEPSPDRIKPVCPHYRRCGGCAAQHVGNAAYRNWKRDVVGTALDHRDLYVSVGDLVDAHGEGRRRMTLHVRFVKGRILAGFMQANSRDLIDLDTCPIVVPALQNAPEIARRLAAPFAASSRGLDIAFTASDEGLDCDIRGVGDIGYDIHVAIADLADQLDLARVTIDGVIELERRKPVLVINGLRVPLPPAGFLQATTLGEETLAGLVLAEVGNARKVADLFCGIGPFALRLATHAAVYAADSNETAIKALRDAAHHTPGLKSVETEVRDLFRNPVFHEDLNRFDAVIFNPARAGAEAQAEELAASDVPLVICVSCDPATLARDAEILVEGGYDFESATPVDQFRYSPHVETIAVFRRS